MRRGIRSLVIFAAAAAVAIAVSGAAVASPPSSGSAAAADTLSGGSTVTLPSGEKVTLPKDFDAMTIDELAAIGIVPGMGEPATAIALTGPVMQPMSAVKCSAQVCIGLSGNGLTIQAWVTQAEGAASTCTYAAYWQNGTILSTTETICGGAGTIYQSAKSGMPRTFANGTVLCNSWVTIAGKPCATVHS